MIEVTVHYPTGRIVNDPAHDRVTIGLVCPKRPFLIWADIHQGEMYPLPKGFGVAWVDPVRARVLMAPMPINVIIGFLIWSYRRTKFGAEYWFFRHSSPRRICEVCTNERMAHLR